MSLTSDLSSGLESGLTLSSGAFLVDGFVSTGVSFSTSGQDTQMEGMHFNRAGTQMIAIGRANDDLYQYTLSTAGKLSSISYDSVTLDISGEETEGRACWINPAGDRVYAFGRILDGPGQYDLGTPNNISTGVFDDSFSGGSQEVGLNAGFFNDEETKFFLLGQFQDTINQYTVGTPGDLSTASFASKSFSISGLDSQFTGMCATQDGLHILASGNSTDKVYQIDLASAYDLTGAAYNGINLDISGVSASPNEVQLTDNDNALIILGGDDVLYEFR